MFKFYVYAFFTQLLLYGARSKAVLVLVLISCSLSIIYYLLLKLKKEKQMNLDKILLVVLKFSENVLIQLTGEKKL